jgi:hypothetical protein
VEKVVFNADSCGMGDTITHAWHAEGYKRLGIPCEFYTTRGDRRELLEMLGQTIVSTPAPDMIVTGGGAEYYNYELRVDRGKTGRAVLWGHRLPGSPDPIKPTITIRQSEIDAAKKWCDEKCGGKPLALLFPFAEYTPRKWPITHYVSLANKLRDAGFCVVAMGAHDGHRNDLGSFQSHVNYFYGSSLNFVAAMMQQALLCIGNDFGPAHLGTLVDTPFYCVTGPTVNIFGHKDSVTELRVGKEQVRCVSCMFNGDAGYNGNCDRGCIALSALTPDAVMDHITRDLKTIEDVWQSMHNNA